MFYSRRSNLILERIRPYATLTTIAFVPAGYEIYRCAVEGVVIGLALELAHSAAQQEELYEGVTCREEVLNIKLEGWHGRRNIVMEYSLAGGGNRLYIGDGGGNVWRADSREASERGVG